MRRLVLLTVAGALVIGCAAGAVLVRGQLHGSLPLLDGSLRLAGLTAPVVVTRDALGIPTVRAARREDVARATGFLHGQDRFFQMDLNRRVAAGELAALVGRRALPVDRRNRTHRFRAEAQTALGLLSPRDRAVLEAYTAGVNGGLQALRSKPFEYFLLGQEPAPWRIEDSLLVVLAMFITLQDEDGAYESALGTMHDVLPREMFEFIVSPGTEWDAPVVGERFAVPPIPGPDVYNLRAIRQGTGDVPLSAGSASRHPAHTAPVGRVPLEQQVRSPVPLRSGRPEQGGGATADPTDHWIDSIAGLAGSPGDATGSNNWVVSGRLTASGAPLVANDMHLGIRVPNIWYRAQFEWPDDTNPRELRRLVGITLPGTPALVVGSNTHIAWGFTNTYADWSDVVELEVDTRDPARYRTPEGWKHFTTITEVIEVAGEASVEEPVTWTIWGPVLAPDHRGRPRAYRWVAHAADRLAAAVTPFETARTVADAIEEASGLGTPGQNLVVADRDGRIAWSVWGSIPRRYGTDGRLPSSWADGDRGWRGWLDDAEYPRVIDPPGGRIWTANARVVDGAMLTHLGDGGYEVGSRATVIRDRLQSGERFTEADMLALQLDARAVFLDRWRDLILQTLTPEVAASRPLRRRFRDLVLRSWDGLASPRSVGYRFTRMFRDRVSEAVMGFLLSECYEADALFDHTVLRRREGPVWKLVTERPLHLLDPLYPSWDALLLASVDDVIARVVEDGGLEDRVWSEYNEASVRHPLSAGVPLFGRWLNMPSAQLPGDLFTVRMQWRGEAASQRMVVSPGRETSGILHMPTGQSGHPLSPFYSNSHAAWVEGRPTPLLAGEEEHRVTLIP